MEVLDWNLRRAAILQDFVASLIFGAWDGLSWGAGISGVSLRLDGRKRQLTL